MAMSNEQFLQLFALLDRVWGGMDEEREEGYRIVLGDMKSRHVGAAVEQLMREDRPFLPRAPEIACRALRFQAAEDSQRYLEQAARRTLARIKREELAEAAAEAIATIPERVAARKGDR